MLFSRYYMKPYTTKEESIMIKSTTFQDLAAEEIQIVNGGAGIAYIGNSVLVPPPPNPK